MVYPSVMVVRQYRSKKRGFVGFDIYEGCRVLALKFKALCID
jgi:hypothetical protein